MKYNFLMTPCGIPHLCCFHGDAALVITVKNKPPVNKK